MKITKWDKRYLFLAKEIAGWSKDPSTKVGAVIIDPYNNPVSFGFNGFAKGVEDSKERLHDRDMKYPLTVHGEINAILNAERSIRGCTLYVTHPPCTNCMNMIVQSGIKRVVYEKGCKDFMERWVDSFKLTLQVAKEGGVDMYEYDKGLVKGGV